MVEEQGSWLEAIAYLIFIIIVAGLPSSVIFSMNMSAGIITFIVAVAVLIWIGDKYILGEKCPICKANNFREEEPKRRKK